MIECKLESGEGYLRSRGDNEEITEEISHIINAIYNNLRNANEDAGQQFKEMMFAEIAFGRAFIKKELNGKGSAVAIARKRGGAEDE